MDRVKAIKVLKPLVDSYVDYANTSMKEEDDDIVDALEMAVEALKVLDVPDTNVGDMISRQAAINELKKISFLHWFECGEYLSEDTKEIEIISSSKALEAIEVLPSAQPDGIPLEWIDKHLEWLDNCDNDFAQLAKVSIKAMVELWKKDRI